MLDPVRPPLQVSNLKSMHLFQVFSGHSGGIGVKTKIPIVVRVVTGARARRYEDDIWNPLPEGPGPPLE